MATENGKRALHELIALALIAALGGGSGAWGYQQIVPARPDPFTGADGRAMEQRLIARIVHLEQEHEAVKAWQREWTAVRADVPQRLYRIEALLETNASVLQRMDQRMQKIEERR